MWKVELHCHTVYSKDSATAPEALIAMCRARGIDQVAVTDHNTMRGAFAAAALAPDLVIPGEEIKTTRGELLGYFLSEEVPKGLSPEETIARLRDQGAVISVAHPFDWIRSGSWKLPDLLKIAPLVDAVEVFNARCLLDRFNARAEAFAAEHDLLGTAGSDAHSGPEYGVSGLMMPPFTDARSFRDALRDAEPIRKRSSFLVHFLSSFARWGKLLRLIGGPK